MTFTGYQQPHFFDLHDIYRIMTAPLFQFMWYLQDLGSLPLLVYAVFTGSRQPPFLDLHDIYRISTAPLFQFTWYLQGLDSLPFSIYVVFTGSRQPPFSIYVVFTMLFTGSRQPPFFNLHGIYRVSTAPLFQFTWYLQCYLQDLGSHPFSIYMVFTGSRQARSYKFTCYLHDMCSFALQYLQYLSFDLHVSTPKFT